MASAHKTRRAEKARMMQKRIHAAIRAGSPFRYQLAFLGKQLHYLRAKQSENNIKPGYAMIDYFMSDWDGWLDSVSNRRNARPNWTRNGTNDPS